MGGSLGVSRPSARAGDLTLPLPIHPGKAAIALPDARLNVLGIALRHGFLLYVTTRLRVRRRSS
jgi:hypothetical protein